MYIGFIAIKIPIPKKIINLMPSLYYTPKRGHFIIYKLYLPSGQIKRKTKYVKTKALAKNIMTEIAHIEEATKRMEASTYLLKFALNNRYINKDEYTAFLGDLGTGGAILSDYEKDYEQYLNINCASTTQTVRGSRLKTILSYFGTLDVSKITESKIEKYRNHRVNNNLAPRSINNELTVLKMLLDFPLTQGIIKENPARKIKPLKSRQVRYPRAIKREEMDRFLKAVEDKKYLLKGRFKDIVYMLFLSGLRRSELVKLTWKNIDLKERIIELTETKTLSQRRVEIHSQLMPILKKIEAKEGLLFPFHPISVSQAFKKCINSAGLDPNITLHSLRHSFISYLIEAGEDIRTVQELAGHKRLSTTQRYMHIVERKKGVVDKIKI